MAVSKPEVMDNVGVQKKKKSQTDHQQYILLTLLINVQDTETANSTGDDTHCNNQGFPVMWHVVLKL